MVLLVFLGIMLVYGVGFAVSLRVAVRLWIQEDEKQQPSLYRTEQDYYKRLDVARNEVAAIAMLWPVVWVPLLAAKLTRGSMETARLKRIRAEAEVDKIKALAREHGLDFPE